MKRSGVLSGLSICAVIIITLVLSIPQRGAHAACGFAVPCPPAPSGGSGDTGEKEKHKKPTATDVPPTHTPTATPTETPVPPTATATEVAVVACVPPNPAPGPAANPIPAAPANPLGSPLPWLLGGGGLLSGILIGLMLPGLTGGGKGFPWGKARVNGDGIVGPDRAWNGDGIVGPDKAWTGDGLSSAAVKLQKVNPELKATRDDAEFEDGGSFHRNQDGGEAAAPWAPIRTHTGDGSVHPTDQPGDEIAGSISPIK